MRHDRVPVVELMTSNVNLDEDKRVWRRSAPMARMFIMERKVYLNDRLVTHTEVSVPRGVPYELKVWDTRHEGFDVYQVMT